MACLSNAAAQSNIAADSALLQAEQEAFQRAVLEASPSLVTIETIGGFDKLGDVRLNTGATTGTVIGKDGWIISSAFNLAGEPQAIFVTLDDGRRITAERIATDEVRKLVLLKADADSLTPLVAAPPQAAVVGRWAIAAGRTYGDLPNVSVGLVSALGRIGGLAIQTDAKVSPANYGGPLLSIRGQAMGLLVPMSPQTTTGGSELAGIEWYDSGIGFAVPMGDVIESARRLRQGDDLVPGRMGIAFTGSGLLDEPAILKTVHPLSPADAGGLKPGDVVTSLNGEAFDGLRTLKLKTAGLYAGETITLGIQRGDETFEASIELAAELVPYEFASLGLVVDIGKDGRAVVRSVAADGPANGEIQSGDAIVKLGDSEIATALSAQLSMQRQRTDQALPISIERDGEIVDVEITPTVLPSLLPDEVAAPEWGELEPDDELVGRWTGTVLGGDVSFWGYVPPAAAAGKPSGLLVWLGDGGNALLPAVRAECHRRNVAILVPSPASGEWTSGDTDAIKAAIAKVVERISIDPRRIAVVTSGTSAPLGLALAEEENGLVRGLILDRPKLEKPPGEVSPERRLLYGVIDREDGRTGMVIKFLEKGRHPVTVLPVPFEDGDALIRWIDWMGRL